MTCFNKAKAVPSRSDSNLSLFKCYKLMQNSLMISQTKSEGYVEGSDFNLIQSKLSKSLKYPFISSQTYSLSL